MNPGTSSSRSLPAVVLGGGIIAVSVARALGSAGVKVWALGNARTDLVMHSRFCTSFTDLGSGDGVQERWLAWLEERPAGDAVVLACSDDALELVARNRARLLELGYLPGESDDRVVLAMLDKLETYRLATAAGVDVPRHFELADAEQLDAALTDSGVGFPCALKPLHSHLFARRFGSDQKLFFARDHGELVQACRKIAEHGLKMMVTEVVPGPEDAFHSLHTYLDENGQPLAKLTKRKLRQHPVGFGMGSYHVTDWNEEVADVALRFCTGVGVRGMANPEFKRDERDGRLKLIECNHRFTMSNELVRRVGLNLPLLAYDRVVGNPVTPLDGYRRGVYLWAPGEDIRAFREARRRGETTFAKWARSLMHPQHIAVLDRSDPGPAIASLRKRMAKLRGSR